MPLRKFALPDTRLIVCKKRVFKIKLRIGRQSDRQGMAAFSRSTDVQDDMERVVLAMLKFALEEKPFLPVATSSGIIVYPYLKRWPAADQLAFFDGSEPLRVFDKVITLFVEKRATSTATAGSSLRQTSTDAIVKRTLGRSSIGNEDQPGTGYLQDSSSKPGQSKANRNCTVSQQLLCHHHGSSMSAVLQKPNVLHVTETQCAITGKDKDSSYEEASVPRDAEKFRVENGKTASSAYHVTSPGRQSSHQPEQEKDNAVDERPPPRSILQLLWRALGW